MIVTPLVSIAAAYLISTVMSVGGLSGAFLLLPFQISILGHTSPAATPTNHLYNVIAIPGGVLGYWREKRLLWPLALITVAGTLPGVILGSVLRIRVLSDPRHFRRFMGAVLVLIGAQLAAKAVRQRQRHRAARTAGWGVQVISFDWRTLVYAFQDRTYPLKTLPLFALALIIGVIGGIYGIGGGAMFSPLLVAIWHLPIHTVAGATLLGTLVTSLIGVACFYVAALFGVPHTRPDLALGLAFGFGGLLGTYSGARLQKHLPARLIEVLLTVVLLGLGLSYLFGGSAA